MSEPDELFLREIMLGDIGSKLSLGGEIFAPLKTFLKKDAWPFHEENIVKTFVYVDSMVSGGRVYGFVSLTCSMVELDDEQRPEEPARVRVYPVYPAIKIVRLAIDTSIRNRSFGKQLIAWAIAHVKDKIMPHAGCRFLIVDAKKESIGFYEKCGFIRVNGDVNQSAEHPMMFIDLHLLN